MCYPTCYKCSWQVNPTADYFCCSHASLWKSFCVGTTMASLETARLQLVQNIESNLNNWIWLKQTENIIFANMDWAQTAKREVHCLRYGQHLINVTHIAKPVEKHQPKIYPAINTNPMWETTYVFLCIITRLASPYLHDVLCLNVSILQSVWVFVPIKSDRHV